MKKKLLFRCLIGAPIMITISLVITIIISLCTGHGEFYAAPHELMDLCGSPVVAVIVQTICSALLGAIIGGSFLIWDIEKWSLLKQTLVHFAVMAVPSFPLAYLLNWLPHYLYGALGYIGAFILMYIIIWLVMYFSTKNKIKKMNKQLDEINKDNK